MSSSARETLPIGATPTFAADGWSVRLPVRAEQIGLSKEVVVRERVMLRRKQVGERVRVQGRLLREELRTSTSGPVDIREQDTVPISPNLDRK